VLTDYEHNVTVSYSGLLPDLFREGQGVIARGRMGADGVFLAEEVLAKHDENYMPPDVADTLKKKHKKAPLSAAGPSSGEGA
jgi:cytochrome c-type biogenesis protein CcmE